MADALERITNLIALLLETSQPLTLDQIVHELGQYPAPPPTKEELAELAAMGKGQQKKPAGKSGDVTEGLEIEIVPQVVEAAASQAVAESA